MRRRLLRGSDKMTLNGRLRRTFAAPLRTAILLGSSASCVDRTAEEGDLSLDGGRTVSDEIGKTNRPVRACSESCPPAQWAVRGLSRVPAVGEKVVEADLQSLGAAAATADGVINRLVDPPYSAPPA